MNKNNTIEILMIISFLPIIIIINGSQYQQHLALGQPSNASVTGQQTFRSAFDTFISSYMDEMKTT